MHRDSEACHSCATLLRMSQLRSTVHEHVCCALHYLKTWFWKKERCPTLVDKGPVHLLQLQSYASIAPSALSASFVGSEPKSKGGTATTGRKPLDKAISFILRREST